MKKIVFTVLFILLAAFPCWATTSFTVETLAKNYKANSIVTLKVTVTNDATQPFNGEVKLFPDQSYNITPDYKIIIKNLLGSKSWLIKVPQGNFNGKIIARLQDKNKILQKNIAAYFVLKEMPAISNLYLVPSGIDVPSLLLNSVKTPQNFYKQYCEIIETDPERSYDFDAYDTIILDNLQLLDLNSIHWSKITRWVEKGGSLIVAGGTMYKLTPQINAVKSEGTKRFDFLPMLESEMGVNLPRGSSLIVEMLKPLPGSQVVYTADGINWIIKKKLGQGRVIVIPLSLRDKTFSSWQGGSIFWQKVIRDISTDAPYLGFENNTYYVGEFNGMLSNLLPMQMPATWVLVAIFASYVLLVGFGNYFILRRNDRRGWMWLTIPFMSVIFFSATYYYGVSQRSNNVLIAETGRISLNEEHADEEIGIGMFVPNRGDYRLSVLGDLLVTSFPDRGRKANIEIDADETTAVFGNMPVWSMQSVTTSKELPSKGNFKISNTKVEGNKVSFTLTNATSYDVQDLIIGQQGAIFYYISEFEKQQNIQVAMDLNQPKSVYEFLQNGKGNVNQAGRRLLNTKENLVMNSLSVFKGIPQTGWIVTGFTQQASIPVKVNGQKQQSIISLFLVRQNVGNLGWPTTLSAGQVNKYRD